MSSVKWQAYCRGLNVLTTGPRYVRDADTFHTSRSGQNDHNFAVDISNINPRIKSSVFLLEFHWNYFSIDDESSLVQVMTQYTHARGRRWAATS